MAGGSPTWRYLAIVKGKRGEFRAMAATSAAVQASTLPLVEITPPTNRVVPLTPLGQVAQTVTDSAAAWAGGPIAFDLRVAGFSPATTPDPWDTVLASARSLGLRALPTVSSADLPGRLAAAAAVAADRGAGAVIRVPWTQCIPALASTAAAVALDGELDRLRTALALRGADMDVLVDFGDMVGPLGSEPSDVLTVLGRLGSLNGWRSVAVGGTSMPAQLAKLGYGTFPMPRFEWDLWLQLRGLVATLPVGSRLREIAFADYAAAAAALPAGAGRTRHPSLRYTSGADVFVLRREAVAGEGLRGFRHLARQVSMGAAPPPFAGNSFSWADGHLRRIAQGTERPGGAELWRQLAVNHHLAVVVDQLAGRPWP